jgi:hypothetical protein
MPSFAQDGFMNETVAKKQESMSVIEESNDFMTYLLQGVWHGLSTCLFLKRSVTLRLPPAPAAHHDLLLVSVDWS